jgi:small-conductance mechanosensitive channel
MSAVGEVQEIGFFFTKIKEVDENDLAFTGKVVSFPNYLIFNSGIFNYTKNDLLFWHEFSIALACRDHDIDKLIENFKDII